MCDYYYYQDDTDEDSMDSLMITNWPCSNVFEVVELKIVDTAQLNHLTRRKKNRKIFFFNDNDDEERKGFLLVHWQKVPFYR